MRRPRKAKVIISDVDSVPQPGTYAEKNITIQEVQEIINSAEHIIPNILYKENAEYASGILDRNIQPGITRYKLDDGDIMLIFTRVKDGIYKWKLREYEAKLVLNLNAIEELERDREVG